MPRLPGDVDGRRFLRAMARLGWSVESQRGSHRKLKHEGIGQIIIVAFHNTIHRNAI
jgi:predicted RNA binding protein YcfA (HicA-like mRNA interferase family)